MPFLANNSIAEKRTVDTNYKAHEAANNSPVRAAPSADSHALTRSSSVTNDSSPSNRSADVLAEAAAQVKQQAIPHCTTTAQYQPLTSRWVYMYMHRNNTSRTMDAFAMT